ncbi:MAG: homoserine dehydrogenase [Nanoarchaeota archaeon]|nr:homoserine dehydrogenase [Nanoarchaeota archaeon]MBU1005895.1 homoserine dehydrogenase [Nanoarchaeota archaeon]MBU1946534.1 homoserine dehydrogenase [Nanoarchaeota archaeon]
MSKEINIGLVGIGTIGSGVVKILNKNKELIEKRTGISINIKKVCDVKLDNAKELGLKDEQLTKNYEELINDKDISIIIELIGGYNPAKDIILKALKAKKHVVTANKALIAKHGKEIFETVKENNVTIAFEAAVGGCIPIIKSIKESYAADNIKRIYGILNGTTNFILTKMEEGMSYSEALKKAQELGFAESNPSFDVEGKDAAQKLAILASLAFNANITEDIFTWGITKLNKNDIDYADQLGYKIKLLGIAKNENGEIELRVHPTMLPKNHELANVKNELNAVYIIGENITKAMLYGKGAGQLPTATVVLGDVIDIAKGKNDIFYFKDIKAKDINKIKSRYYLRYLAMEKPGVLAKITKVLGDNQISIAAVEQKEINKETVPIIMTTHEATEENMMKSVKEINKLDIIKEDTVVIRIENIS